MTATPRALSSLLRDAGVRPLGDPGADPAVTAVRVDSRAVEPGDLFCALRGEHVDGTTFVPQALARGAVAVLAASERPEELPEPVAWVRVENDRAAVGPLARETTGRPDAALTVVGVTGTNGKTTVSWMVDAIARAAGRRSGRIGTIDTAWGDVVRPARFTTPEAPDLYALLAEMRDAGTEMVAMEVSSHALALGRVGGMRFAVAAFLNLGRDHLDFHGDVESYFDAKAVLFESLASDAVAVLPDHGRGLELRDRTAARVVTFGRSPEADVRIRDERIRSNGSAATLETRDGAITVRTALVGRFQIGNAAAAAACALAAGLPPEAVERGLSGLDRIPGRTETVDRGQAFGVWIDYAHTEEALAGVLDAAREVASGRVLVAFGCGGDRDHGKRAPMGACAARRADVVVLTSDNPRGEDPETILDAIEAGVRSAERPGTECVREPDRRRAIRAVLDRARSGDVVVIAGKGHETGQTANGRTMPFDDRTESEAALDAIERDGRTGADA